MASPTGIVGTVLGGTALAAVASKNTGCGNNGLLGGLFGGNNECYETKEAAALRASEAYWRGAAETNQKITDTYAFLNGEMAKRDQVIAGLAVEAAVNKERNACQSEKIAKLEATVAVHGQEICNIKSEAAVNAERVMSLAASTKERMAAQAKEFYGAISLEAERRACGDEKILTYVDGTFIPGVLKIPSRRICDNPVDVQVVEGSTIKTTR